MTHRQRIWITSLVVAAVAAVAPTMVLLGHSNLADRARQPRALVFDERSWLAESGEHRPDGHRGLMVPNLIATGRLAGKTEPEVRALLGEPDCPRAPGGPFAGEPRLAYWVGRVGSAKRDPNAPPPAPECLYLRLIHGKVVQWETEPPAAP